MNHTVQLTDSQLRQILYCMESMASDYEPGTDDSEDYESAMLTLQSLDKN